MSMEAKRENFTDTEAYKKGRAGEKLIEKYLLSKGAYIIPSYDYCGENNDKAPRMFNQKEFFVLPDLDVSIKNQRIWVEVKTYHSPDFTRITGRYEHGIKLRHFNNYKKVQEITGAKVLLFIFEEISDMIIYNYLDELEKHKRIYSGDKMGKGGMIFFPRDKFIEIKE